MSYNTYKAIKRKGLSQRNFWQKKLSTVGNNAASRGKLIKLLGMNINIQIVSKKNLLCNLIF